MGQRYILGEFEELVLLAIMKLGNDAYSVPISDAIEEGTGREVTVGALFSTLNRLEEKNFISSWMGEKTAERGGRAKKYYRLEIAGKQALQEAENARRTVRGGMELAFN